MHKLLDMPARRASLPSLIAWLSVTLLAAAFGHSLDARWQQVWALAGAFGLVAAVGLGSIERFRAAREYLVRQRAVRERLEAGFAQLQAHSVAIESINQAVRRIAEHAVVLRHDTVAHGRVKRWQALLLRDFPCELTPVDIVHAHDKHANEVRIAGHLRQIASRSITFEHQAPFGARLVLLTFTLAHNERLAFVVDVIWTQVSGDRLASAGTVLAVGVPALTGSANTSQVEAAALP